MGDKQVYTIIELNQIFNFSSILGYQIVQFMRRLSRSNYLFNICGSHHCVFYRYVIHSTNFSFIYIYFDQALFSLLVYFQSLAYLWGLTFNMIINKTIKIQTLLIQNIHIGKLNIKTYFENHSLGEQGSRFWSKTKVIRTQSLQEHKN